MIPIILSVVAFCVLVAEFWTVNAVVGLSGEDMLIEREKSPSSYWFMMALHTLIGVIAALAVSVCSLLFHLWLCALS